MLLHEAVSLDLVEVLNWRAGKECWGPVIYCVVDDRHALWYIGQTRQAVAKRIAGHLQDESSLLRVYLSRHGVRGWVLDVYSLAACKRRWPEICRMARSASEAEKSLIAYYRPPLNTIYTGRQRNRARSRRYWGFWRWVKSVWGGR